MRQTKTQFYFLLLAVSMVVVGAVLGVREGAGGWVGDIVGAAGGAFGLTIPSLIVLLLQKRWERWSWAWPTLALVITTALVLMGYQQS